MDLSKGLFPLAKTKGGHFGPVIPRLFLVFPCPPYLFIYIYIIYNRGYRGYTYISGKTEPLRGTWDGGTNAMV